ncbi:MAG: TIGR03943 family protein [Actinomycetia bacterium]|nr:TIGR03943 family protein [Actinomycetes bacterium]MCH9702722.1 TIGR03943 family protein [Actinomycetes bacterium]MCH9761800.1 TIGR03943 family protein [Actinomycetes bacterium]
MSRESENALLLLVGVCTMIITITGAYTRYVKPALQPWLFASAVVLIALALVAIVRDVRRGPEQRAHHDHSHSSRALWLLMVPIGLLGFVVPPALGAQSGLRTVTEVSTDVLRRPYPPLPDERAPEISLPELLVRNARDSNRSLDDRLVTVTGFTMKDGDRTDLGRIVILCCAADGQLARVTLDGPAAEEVSQLPEDTWVKVEGKVPAGQDDSSLGNVPVMIVESAQQIEPPENTYVY